MSSEDVVSKELQRIIKSFDKKVEMNPKIKELLRSRKSYEDVNEYAVELGKILSAVFNEHISEDSKDYIREILNDRLKMNHHLINEYGFVVQTNLNKKANINLAAQKISIKQDKIDGIVNRLENEDFEKTKWLLGSPIVTYSQSIVDRMVEKNAKMHYESGLSPKIARKESGNCCKWCRNLVGVYKYPDVPEDVYRRHNNCGCTVDYIPKDGKTKHNVHTKKMKPIITNSNDNLPYKSVKTEWLKKYKEPKVTDMNYWEHGGVKYFVDGKNVVLDYSEKEKEVAQWVSKTFGANVKLAPRVNNPENIPTPDYLINNMKFDLKEITGSGKSTVDNNTKKAKVQAENIIFDLTNTPLSEAEFFRQLQNVYKHGNRGLKVSIVKKGGILIDILENKK